MAGDPQTDSFLQSMQIFHPIFDDFIHLVNDSDIQPTADDLKNVHEPMYFLSEISRMEDGQDGGTTKAPNI